MKSKQPQKRYQTDLRINATPRQVVASMFRGDAPKQVEKPKLAKEKQSA